MIHLVRCLCCDLFSFLCVQNKTCSAWLPLVFADNATRLLTSLILFVHSKMVYFLTCCTLIHQPVGCDVSNNLLKSKQIMSHVFFLSGVCVTSLKNSSRFVKQDLPFIRLCWLLFISAHISPDVLWSHHLLMSPWSVFCWSYTVITG